MWPIRWSMRFLLLGMFGLYLCLWPGSTLLVMLGRVPDWGVWIGGALIMMQGLVVGLWLWANYKWKGTIVAFLILVLSWAVEHLGATTGFPFGSYGYTTTLQPQLSGVVPLAIPFAWLLVVPSAIGVTSHLLADRPILARRPNLRLALYILCGASLALLLDMTIEPVAVHVNNYWVWRESGVYYGVPLSNFAGWWGTSALLVGLTLLLIPNMVTTRTSTIYAFMLPALYFLNLLMFVLINLAYNQILASVIGALLLVTLIVYEARRRGVRFLLKARS